MSVDPFARAGLSGLAGTLIVALILLGGVLADPPVARGADNPIVVENRRPGTGDWQLPWPGATLADDTANQIKGYASATKRQQGREYRVLRDRESRADLYDGHLPDGLVWRMGWQPDAAR